MTWGHMLTLLVLAPICVAAGFTLAADRAHKRRWRAEEPFEIWPYPKEK